MKSFLSCLVLFLFFSPFASSQGVTSYQLAELIPYSWVELAPGSLNGTQIYVNDSCVTVNADKARNITFFGTSYNKFVASRQGFLSFVQSVCTSSALDAATNPSGECPYPLSAIGTGIAMFYGYTTQLNPSTTDPPSKEYYKYFTTCPYPGLAEFGGCHVIEYVASQWTGFVKSIAITTEVLIGDNGAVVMQWKDQNPNLWLGALVGVGSTTGAGFVVSYPRGVQNRQCPWGNSSTTPLLALEQKAITFYPLNVPMPCDSDHNITFTNSDGERGCTCEDFDGDGFVCPENDACPFDGTKSSSKGVCGCGVSDVDSDGDGTPDCVDACPSDPNKWVSAGLCGCGQLDYEPGSYALTCGDASSLSSWLSQFKNFFLL